MTPPTHFDGRRTSNPAESDTPPLALSRDTLAQICARRAKAPVLVTQISDHAALVQRLRFLRFDRDSGCVVDAPLHAKPSRHGAK